MTGIVQGRDQTWHRRFILISGLECEYKDFFFIVVESKLFVLYNVKGTR